MYKSSFPDMLSTPLNSTDNFIEKAYENQPQVKAAETRILSAQKQIEITKTIFTLSYCNSRFRNILL
jgi:outer membrane protein TolC